MKCPDMRSVGPHRSHPPGGRTDPCSHLPCLPVSLVQSASDSAEGEPGLPCHCVMAGEKAVSLFPKRQPSLSGPWGLAPPAAFLGTMCPRRGCVWETVGLNKLSIGLCPQTRAGDQGHLLAGALNLDTIPPSPACPQQSGSGHLLQAWAARESQTDPQAGGPSGQGGSLGLAPLCSPSGQGAAQPNLEAMWLRLVGHLSPPDFTRLSHPVISSTRRGRGAARVWEPAPTAWWPPPPSRDGRLSGPALERLPVTLSPCELPAARESLECRATGNKVTCPPAASWVRRWGKGRRLKEDEGYRGRDGSGGQTDAEREE